MYFNLRKEWLLFFTAQSHLLRKVVDPATGRFYLGLFLSIADNSQVSFMAIVFILIWWQLLYGKCTVCWISVLCVLFFQFCVYEVIAAKEGIILSQISFSYFKKVRLLCNYPDRNELVLVHNNNNEQCSHKLFYA